MEMIIASVLISVVICVIILSQLKHAIDTRLDNHRDNIEYLREALDSLNASGKAIALPQGSRVQILKKTKLEPCLPIEGHTIIVGKSNSGKSHAAMDGIIQRIDAGQQLFIIDTKDELGPLFGNHCVRVTNTQGAEGMMKELLDVAENRRKIFKDTSLELQSPVRDLKEYTAKTGERMPIVTLVVEELVFLMEEIEDKYLTQLLVMGRSAGVYVLAISQLLKADILPRKASINFQTKVWLGNWDPIAVRLLFLDIDKPTSERLSDWPGEPGKAVVQFSDGNYKALQLPFIGDEHLTPYMRGNDE